MDTQLRQVEFYGGGRIYVLTTWDDVHGRAETGQHLIRYDFRQVGADEPLFAGKDFGVSPQHAIDSDEALAALMGFLTLQPGDTDPDYFAGYTEAQMAFAEGDAEAVKCDAMGTFGEEAWG